MKRYEIVHEYDSLIYEIDTKLKKQSSERSEFMIEREKDDSLYGVWKNLQPRRSKCRRLI